MDPVLEDTKFVTRPSLWPRGSLLLALVIYICDSPEGIVALFSLGINKAGPQFHGNRDVVVALNRDPIELAVLVDDFTHDLELVIAVTLYVCLKGLLSNNLVTETLDLDLDLEGVAFKDHEFILEVIRVVVDRDPNRHGVVLKLTVHLVHLKTIIQVLL